MFRCGKRSPCLIVGAGEGSNASLMSALGAENAVPVGWAREVTALLMWWEVPMANLPSWVAADIRPIRDQKRRWDC